MGLRYKDSPYKIEPDKRILKTINLAINKVGKQKLLNLINCNEKRFENYLKNWIPFYWVEVACEINKQDIWVPINYQELWFCLNGIKVRRKLPSGRVITPKVSFKPIYVEPKKEILEFLENAITRCRGNKRKEFVRLVDRAPQSLDNWRAKRAKIPVTALMKSCQILKKDVWEFLDGIELYSSGHSIKEHIIFNNRETPELAEIMAWIKTDGHIFINKTCLYFVQNEEGFECVKDIVVKLCKLFGMPKNKMVIKRKEGKPKAKSLYLWSAPLRQILCLRYDIPIGLKSKIIDFSKEMGICKEREDKLRLLSAVFQSEGFFVHYNSKKFPRPKLSLTTSSKKAGECIHNVIKELGYNTYKRYDGAYRIGIESVESSAKFFYDILPYFRHKGKVCDIIFGKKSHPGLLESDYLKRIRIQNKNLKKLFEETKNHLNLGSLEFFEYLGNEFSVSKALAEEWFYGKRKVPINVIVNLCKKIKEDVFNFLPPYLSFLLFVYGLIDYDKLRNLRGLEYDKVAEVFYNGR